MALDDDDAATTSLPPPTVPLRLTRGKVSVAHLMNDWYIACASDELRSAPLARTVLGVPMALFRDESGKAVAALDRCPHRNVPLSPGKVVSGQLQCPYHGWRFDGEGRCRAIPTRATDDTDVVGRRVPVFPVREQDGFVWVVPTPGATPTRDPYRFALLDAPGYDHVRQVVTAPGTLHATIENALDVPHTAFLHRGLFRGDSRGLTLEVIVRRTNDRVEAEYKGESRPPGLVGRLLSPSGGEVEHFDRFLLPSVAEVEYRLGPENHLLVASAMTPVSDFETRIYAVVSFKLRAPHAVVKAALKPVALAIFKQDAAVLGQQTAQIKAFGGEQFASTEVDVLGRHIWRLLRAAEGGDTVSPTEERVTLVV